MQSAEDIDNIKTNPRTTKLNDGHHQYQLNKNQILYQKDLEVVLGHQLQPRHH